MILVICMHPTVVQFKMTMEMLFLELYNAI